MNIKKLLRNSLIIILPFFLILYVLFCINILTKDFTYGHKYHNWNPGPNNWLLYKTNYLKFKVTDFFLNKNLGSGLPRVDIFIPEKTTNKLLSNPPSSTKKYLPSKMIINNKVIDTRIRYLGDNPINYLLDKKSLRIKTRKKDISDKKRYFEYRFTQTTPLRDYTAFKLAEKMGVLSSDVRLVELFINRKSNGIFLEKERLNENFLRRNKIMPVNLYKGEQEQNLENKIGLTDDLFKNSGMWEKVSIFNIFDTEDRSDLEFFLNNLKNSENNPNYLNRILDNGNKEILAKKMVLEILLQNELNNDTHNQRISIDNWSGKIYHIPHDTAYNLENINENNLFSDISPGSLNRILNQSSIFLDKKFQLIFDYVNNKKIFRKLIDELKNIQKEYLISEKRDFGSVQRTFFKGKGYDEKKGKENFDNFFNSFIKREEKILEVFKKNPNGSWELEQNNFNIKVNQILPLSNIIVNFKNQQPKWIALDFNNNSILDNEDIVFKKKNNNSFYLDISLFSNRIPVLDLSRKPFGYKTHITNTKFKFFVSDNIKPENIFVYNDYLKKKFKLKETNNISFNPTINNIPIINILDEQVKTFNGELNIYKDLIVEEVAIIEKGTTFNLSKGVSIIFKNKVIAEGTSDQKIIFKPNNKNQKWGTIALQGNKTKNSLFKNILIEGGSGDIVNGINYFSSFSVHSTENIKFQNITIKNNFDYDDMVHVVYSKNLFFEKLDLHNAYRDAIDIDISSNINVKDLKIINSGNDGIDLMESEVKVEKCFIDNSGDKGISVGEGSKLNLNICEIRNGKFGIASKDASTAIIKKTSFIDNKFQLSTYKKNWRYNDSGKIYLENSLFSSKKNKLIDDNFGEIKVLSSNFEGDIVKEGNVLIK